MSTPSPDHIQRQLGPGDTAFIGKHGKGLCWLIKRAGAATPVRAMSPDELARAVRAGTYVPPGRVAPRRPDASYPSRQQTPVVGVRLSAPEKAALERLASQLGVSVSDVVRARLSAADKPLASLTPLEAKAELEALRAEAYAQLEDYERQDAAKIADPAARARFVAKRLARKRAK